ncbi:uncharacterized protein EV154DRAFT_481567 [Mucor mucedo]|uniref:uncharacterized protein n=1 Tax=Mucor mucedo TaxID=29922 RepID=UPI00221F7FCB|nr:uncharacterized protein EV154DRAFT_481567 [Mucor mucedo]KAI7891047.1 hypothetical protein EV154DRAFT_481567 [Mucor mucedo]
MGKESSMLRRFLAAGGLLLSSFMEENREEFLQADYVPADVISRLWETLAPPAVDRGLEYDFLRLQVDQARFWRETYGLDPPGFSRPFGRPPMASQPLEEGASTASGGDSTVQMGSYPSTVVESHQGSHSATSVASRGGRVPESPGDYSFFFAASPSPPSPPAPAASSSSSFSASSSAFPARAPLSGSAPSSSAALLPRPRPPRPAAPRSADGQKIYNSDKPKQDRGVLIKHKYTGESLATADPEVNTPSNNEVNVTSYHLNQQAQKMFLEVIAERNAKR